MEIVEFLKELFSTAAKFIDLIGILILLIGFFKLLIKYALIETKNIKKTPIRLFQKVRLELGVYILLALDFLVASDIIESVLGLTQKELIVLSALIAIRISIGYFLGKELNELSEIDTVEPLEPETE